MLTERQAELADLMSLISEQCYCAGWLDGNEYRLWAAVADPNDDRKYGMGEIDQADVEQLRALSQEIGGWIVWDDEVTVDFTDPHWCRRFVPMAQWLTMYEDFAP